LDKLVNRLVVFAIAFPSMLLLQLFIFWYWKHRMNRAYYTQLLLPADEPDDLRTSKPEQRWCYRRWCCWRRRRRKTKARFVPLPGLFIFPSLSVLVCIFFQTGLVMLSVQLICECRAFEPEDDQPSCTAPGIAVLVMVALFLLLNFLMLLHFNMRYRERVFNSASATEASSPPYACPC
jgi:hypothetical protein